MSNRARWTAALRAGLQSDKQTPSLRDRSADIDVADADEIALSLPPPMSVNEMRKLDKAKLHKLKTWTRHADGLVYESGGARRLGKITGPFEAHVVYDQHLNRIDVDNGLKCILDYAVRLELVPDDAPKYLRKLVVELGHAPHGIRLTLRAVA
jgi:hypothetical protein